MKPKVVKAEDGTEYIEMKDGKPVFVDDGGKEIAVDVPSAFQKITDLQAESKNHRISKEEAEGKLKKFEGIEDPEAAKKALTTVKNLDDKQLVDAGEVDKIKNEAIKAVEEKFAPVVAERDELKLSLNNEMIGGRFSRSKFIGEKVAVPADFIEAKFRSNFSIEDGKVIAKDSRGNQIFSKANPGEPAGFDEALEILVDNYEFKDSVLKGTGSSGTGASGSGSGTGGKSTMSRAEFDKLPPMDQSKVMMKGEVQVID